MEPGHRRIIFIFNVPICRTWDSLGFLSICANLSGRKEKHFSLMTHVGVIDLHKFKKGHNEIGGDEDEGSLCVFSLPLERIITNLKIR